jgi:hypothetical protein
MSVTSFAERICGQTVPHSCVSYYEVCVYFSHSLCNVMEGNENVDSCHVQHLDSNPGTGKPLMVPPRCNVLQPVTAHLCCCQC